MHKSFMKQTTETVPIDPRDLELLSETYSGDTIPESRIRGTFRIGNVTYVCTGQMYGGKGRGAQEVFANEVVKLAEFSGKPRSYNDAHTNGCMRNGYEGILVKHRNEYMVLSGKRASFVAGKRERRELFDL